MALERLFFSGRTMVRRKINQAIDETNGLLRIQVRPFKLNRDAFSQRAIKQRVFRGGYGDGFGPGIHGARRAWQADR